MELEWVKIIGSKDVPGRPNLYGTTKIFLDSHNLKSLAELPRLPESQEMSSEIVSDQMNLESLNEEDSKKVEETDSIH
jgi:chromosome segregation and condensation protein ScpB